MKKLMIFVFVLLVAGIACCVAACSMGVGELSLEGVSSAPRFLKYQETAVDKGLDAHAEIDRLVLDIDAAECVVQIGDENKLTAGSDTKWRLTGDTLTVEQEKRNGWWWRSKSAPMTLTLRKDGLSNLDIDVDAGTVTVCDVTATQGITCDVDAGAVEMKDVFAGALDFNVDAGAISYRGKVVGPAKLECDAGAIDVVLQDGSTIGKITGSVDMGEVTASVNGKNVLNHDGWSETVSTAIPGAIGNDLLTFDCDVGSISIDLTVMEKGKT